MPLPTVSLIITTYNWPEALKLVLMSALAQSTQPKEIIIADDGSTQPTRDLIAHFQRLFPLPLIHCWQQDQGFRAARARNLAIARATGEYLVMIDGDMILHRHFISDHQAAARPGQFIQGRRVILTQALSQQAIAQENIAFNWLSPQVKNKINALRFPLLSPLISTLFTQQHYRSVRSCNLAVWRQDLIKINGFNEAFVGWGREDSECVVRLLNSGITRKDLRLAGVAYHLFHPENTRDNLPTNDQLLSDTITKNLSYCHYGLAQHLDKNASNTVDHTTSSRR